MKLLRRLIFFVIISPGQFLICQAQPHSYIYIQGDKQTPFYVKLDGEMQPRYGKNYSILSGLVPGPVRLEILFQQNAFPAQHFTVVVPEGRSRGFLLTKSQDSFALYDIQQGAYLTNGNIENDEKPLSARVSTNVINAGSSQEKPMQVVKTPERHKPEAAVIDEARPEKSNASDTISGEHFIDGITLGNEHTSAPVVDAQRLKIIPLTTLEEPVINTPQAAAIRNTDCPAPVSKEDFGPIYKGALTANDDESRTAYVLGQMDKCYAAWQARALASMLSTDAARFTILKKIYPRIADQQNFPLLDDLLREASYKEAFTNLLHPKQ